MLFYNFQALLKVRNYDGILDFKIDEELLDLQVTPHNDTGNKPRTDARTLSGGERSYSTVTKNPYHFFSKTYNYRWWIH